MVTPEVFTKEYAHVFEGDERWRALPMPEGGGELFAWDEASTYVRKPPFFYVAYAGPATGYGYP